MANHMYSKLVTMVTRTFHLNINNVALETVGEEWEGLESENHKVAYCTYVCMYVGKQVPY